MPLDFNAVNASLEEASVRIAKSREDLQGLIPDLLFHYTSSQGLRGILESSRLWATNYRFLNDSAEIAHGVGLFEALIRRRLETESDQVRSEFLNRTLRTANAFNGMVDCYIVSFCQGDDLLSQWRTYAESGGGFALGMKAREIGHRWGELDRTQDFMLRRVEYNKYKQETLLVELIDTTLEVLRFHTRGVSVDDADNLIARCCQFVRAEAADYLLTFKHSAFESEQEWRLCHVVTPGNDSHVKFRDGLFGLTPYVALDISPMAGVHHNKLPLARITYGPGRNQENVRFALDKLLRAMHYGFVEMAGSALPMRVGA